MGSAQRAAHTVLSEKLLVRRRASPHNFLGWGLCRQLCQHPGEASRRPPPFFFTAENLLRKTAQTFSNFGEKKIKCGQILVKITTIHVRASTFA
jgi:hypothetical protein